MTQHIFLLDPTAAIYSNTMADLISAIFNREVTRCDLAPTPRDFLAEYDRWAGELDRCAGPSSGVSVWALLDQPFSGAALSKDCDYEALVQLLLLTFPDLRWNLLPRQSAGTSAIAHNDDKLLLAIARGVEATDLRIEPAFDRDGFQAALRKEISDALKKNGRRMALPFRALEAAAVDEEESYAYFNAYTAFRFGLRADVVNSEALLNHLFGQQSPARNTFLCIEDLYLSFADRGVSGLEDTVRLSDFAQRDAKFPGLSAARHRVIVTVGHHLAPVELFEKSTSEPHTNQRQRREVLLKPLGGIFALWKGSGMWREMRRKRRCEGRPIRGDLEAFAPGFQLCEAPEREADDSSVAHSAPGRLLLVASYLISRAESRLPSVRSVKEAVLGAVLATQASELLQRRTPTTAFEALSLKHCFEVLAECQFEGVERMRGLEERFAEISAEAKAISRWFAHRRRKKSELNARLKISSRLALTFRGLNQFDEEQRCLAESRRLYQELWFTRHPVMRVFQPVVLYVNFLLGSLSVFIACMALWIVVLAALYRLAGVLPHHGAAAFGTWSAALSAGFQSFLTLQKAGDMFIWVDGVAIVLGFVHLGVFISHLYSLSSRR